MSLLFPDPPKINKELLEIIEQTKREIADAFRMDHKYLGKQRSRPTTTQENE